MADSPIHRYLLYTRLKNSTPPIANSFEKIFTSKNTSINIKKNDDTFLFYSDEMGVLRFRTVYGGNDENDKKIISLEFS